MEMITLKPTDSYKIPVGVKKADGTVEPVADGETFTVSSTMPAVVPGLIDATDPLHPDLIASALTLPGPNTATGIVLTVSDSKGDTVVELGVNYPEPVVTEPGQVTLDLANATITEQPAPTATAP